MRENIKVIFFDRGNTTNNCRFGLSNDDKETIRNENLTEAINSRFNKNIHFNSVVYNIIQPWKSTFKERDKRGYEIKLEGYIADFLDKYNINHNQEDIHEIIMGYGRSHVEWDIPNDGITELFQFIKGKGSKIGILSNSAMHGDIYKNIYDYYGLSQYIDDYVFSYDINFRKPDKNIFLYACERLSVNPENCIMVGDKIDKDIIGAKKVGMRTIWYNYDGKFSSNEPDWEISHFREMTGILEDSAIGVK